MEKAVKAAAKLYECRDTAKKFFGAEYKTTLEPYIDIVKKTMAANNCNELRALLNYISKTNMYNDSGMAQMLFMAAVVELIEPSKD